MLLERRDFGGNVPLTKKSIAYKHECTSMSGGAVLCTILGLASQKLLFLYCANGNGVSQLSEFVKEGDAAFEPRVCTDVCDVEEMLQLTEEMDIDRGLTYRQCLAWIPPHILQELAVACAREDAPYLFSTLLDGGALEPEGDASLLAVACAHGASDMVDILADMAPSGCRVCLEKSLPLAMDGRKRAFICARLKEMDDRGTLICSAHANGNQS